MPSLPILAVLVGYGVLLVIVGLMGRGTSRTVAGYFVADKRLPAWVIAFSTNATGESAWLLLGLTGMGYAVGVHALWVVLGEVAGVAIGWAVVALPFKAYTDRYDSITVPDYLSSRFQDRSHVFRLLGLVIIVSMVTAYTAAQLTAIGKAFNSFVGTSYPAGVVLGTVIILFYTTVGGFKAVAYSDLVQGLMMFVGLLLMPLVGFVAAGGWTEVTSRLAAQEPALLQPMGRFGLTLPGFVSVAGFLAIGFAFTSAPQLLVRWISARDRRQIVHGGVIAVLCTTRAGAIAGMVAGFATAVIWAVAFKSRVLDLYEMIPGFVMGFGSTIVVSLMTRPPFGAAEEMAEVHDSCRR